MDADVALKYVRRLHRRLIARRSEIQLFEDFYAGKQPLTFATEEWKKANGARYADFSDNWCRPVVDAEAERIQHTGLKISENPDGAKLLWDSWRRNEMEMQSSQGFVTSLSSKRSYVLVWGSEKNEPVISWEHPSQVEIEYDWANFRERVCALKTWVEDDWEFATLYEPEAVWKFQRRREVEEDETKSQAQQARVWDESTGGWEPRLVDDVWPLSNPMGIVPIVEVPNRPMLSGDPISEIQGVIPMQNAINLLWAYMFLGADYASMPARVVLHQGPPVTPILDNDGNKIGEKPVDLKDLAEKRLLYLSGENTSIDSWEAARLDVFTDAIEVAVGHIAAQTRTPPTYLVTKSGMSNVNGEGLKASEIGLVKKTLEFQSFASPALREIYRLMALVKGNNGLSEQARLATITWANPEIRSEAQLADALLKKKQMGYPFEYLLELDGLDPVEVERVLAMREAEQFDLQIAAANRELNNIANPTGIK